MKAYNQLSLNLHGGLFEQIYSEAHLAAAFKAVKRNNGAPGVDGVTVEQFGLTLKRSLQCLSEDVKDWRYKPQPVKRVEIPKPNGDMRLLGIPTVRDRVLQMSIKMTIEPLIDHTFSKDSFGFRPGRNQTQAVTRAKQITQSGKEWVVDMDLSKFFDRINHDRLTSRLKRYFDDRRVIRLIGMTLRSGITENGRLTLSLEGSVQGSPLSPLLSNVVLDELDQELTRRGHEFCRYADDVNIFVRSEKAGHRVMASLTKYIEKKLKLVVNKDKSQVALTSAVKFLGMTILAGALVISKVSMDRAMEKVKTLTPRGTHLSLEVSIDKINRWYRGWSSYYKMTEYPGQLAKIEAHIRRRLRCRLIVQQKKRSYLAKKLIRQGCSEHDVYKAVYSNQGNWALSKTYVLHRSFPNLWFKERGLFIRSDEDWGHWKSKKEWIRFV